MLTSLSHRNDLKAINAHVVPGVGLKLVEVRFKSGSINRASISSTYKELVAEGEQQLDAVDLLLRFQRKTQLKDQPVQLPVLVLVHFSHLHRPQEN